MQIENIILYKDVEHVRVLSFELGKVNIITGESKSGKTAIVNIIDYCLGSSECKIAEGVIRDNVHWFAITLAFDDDERYLVARMNPNIKNVTTITEVSLLKITKGEIPNFNLLQNNSNIDALKVFLSKKIGISENIQIPENNTRDKLEVNFSHARLYSFQPQTLVAQQDYLFYKQTEPFVLLAMKDSLPYFLGAIREDELNIEKKITQKKRNLNRLVREKREQESLNSEGASLAFTLIDEAKEFGILDQSINPQNFTEALCVLNSIKDWECRKVEPNINGKDSVLKSLLEQRNNAKVELGKLEDSIVATREFIDNNFTYSEEVGKQKSRLSSIGLFSENNKKENICPLCNSILKVSIPTVTAIQNSLEDLKRNLEQTTREKPRLLKYQTELEDKADRLRRDILKCEHSITALYEEKENARKLRDLNLQRGKVIGKVSLFLESIDSNENQDLDKDIESLKQEINDLMALIDRGAKEDKMQSIICKINLHMSNWVKELDVEYPNALIRFDPVKFTIIADMGDKSIPLSQLGSGANWVSYHLLIHFALHEHFIQMNRPVPRFLVIDQPTQVYFPPETDILNDGHIQESSDEIAVKKMFDFIINRTNSFDSKFQVIITDHAYLNDDNFKSCIREVWRDGKKLIPNSWLESSDDEQSLI